MYARTVIGQTVTMTGTLASHTLYLGVLEPVSVITTVLMTAQEHYSRVCDPYNRH